MTRYAETIEVITRDQRRRRWSAAGKVALVRRTYESGMNISLVARQEGVAASLLFTWRRLDAENWQDGRKGRTPANDETLLANIRRQIAQLPTYGYRRTAALLNRDRRSQGQAPLNHKRIYRLMAKHHLLLPKAPRRRHSSRVHDGKVSVPPHAWHYQSRSIS